jgi:hypothetical protein
MKHEKVDPFANNIIRTCRDKFFKVFEKAMSMLAVSAGRSVGFCRSPDFWAIGAGLLTRFNRPEIWAPTRPSSLMKRLTVFWQRLTLRQQITMKEPS